MEDNNTKSIQSISEYSSITIYSDGACSRRYGGYATIVISGDEQYELVGGVSDTTNNRMELLAAIAPIELLRGPMNITVYSDSRYLVDGASRWMKTWMHNGWSLSRGKRAGGGIVKNIDLWARIFELNKKHKIQWEWVRGHSGNKLNERADKLAEKAALYQEILTYEDKDPRYE